MRWTSFALVAIGIVAISAAIYFATAGSGDDRIARASLHATPTATSPIPATATPASPLDLAVVQEVQPPEAPIEPLSDTPAAADASAPASPTATVVAIAPTATPVVVLPTVAAPPRAPTQAPPPPPPAPTSTPVPPPPAAPASFSGLEQQMLAAHNAARAAAGLAPLQGDGALSDIARIRAQDMATNGYFSHTSPSGQTAFSLLNSSGYRYSLGGENLARNNYPDAQSVSMAMSGFMASTTHRANVLEPRFRNVGIALVVAPDGMKYFVVVFAAP